MLETLLNEPFGHQPLPDVHLRDSPLVRVIVQLRFPASTELLADQSRIYAVGREIAEAYPAFEQGNEVSFNVTADGVVPAASATPRWQFRSVSGSEVVVITPTSIALETTAYQSREDLLNSLRLVLKAALPAARPAYIERVGVRYTNHVVKPEQLQRLSSLFREALFASKQIPSGDATLVQTFTESVFTLSNNSGLAVRSGVIPAGAAVDPGIAARGAESYVLDLDAHSQDRVPPGNSAGVLDRVSDLAEQAYRFFLWALTDEGFTEFGGESK
jgi:uncharacterized protein (TIGR04255 family)